MGDANALLARCAHGLAKHAGRWERTNLNPATQIAVAVAINASDQVVGDLYFTNGTSAFLSEGGGPVVDLNTLLPPGSGLHLFEADQVDDLGEISAQGRDANGDNHVVLLIPCDGEHQGVEGCDYGMADASTAPQVEPSPRIATPAHLSPAMHGRRVRKLSMGR